MKIKQNINELSEAEIKFCFSKAKESSRQRFPKILHEKGSYFNQVFNFMFQESYMQPHLHPGEEKKENIYVLYGKIAIFIFDNNSNIKDLIILTNKNNHIEIPSYTWHTYVILSEKSLTYETMNGKYDPNTWKEMAIWAPKENEYDSKKYLNYLRKKVNE